ncbi:TPA: hypothetical protein NGT37_000568 [Vibrio parahaemolyticus]|nr:hypothetical protein [Vibrio parahaemolyticus]
MQNQNNNTSINAISVSFCDREYQVKKVSLQFILEKLRNQSFKSQLDEYRAACDNANDKKSVSKYDYIAYFRPHVSYAGGLSLKVDNITQHEAYDLSGVIHADLDNVAPEDYNNVVEKLESTNPLFYFKSPNGGVKVFWPHNLESTLENKAHWTSICRAFVRDTLNSLDLGQYYDPAPTHVNANCFFSAGDGFVFKECQSEVKDLSIYASEIKKLSERASKLESRIHSAESKLATSSWQEISEARQNSINTSIKKKFKELTNDVHATKSKSKGNNQSFKLAAHCRTLGVGYYRTLSEMKAFKRQFAGASWDAERQTEAAFQSHSKFESFTTEVVCKDERIELDTVKARIKEFSISLLPTFNREFQDINSVSDTLNNEIDQLLDDAEEDFKHNKVSEEPRFRNLNGLITVGGGKSHAVKDRALLEAKKRAFKSIVYLATHRDATEYKNDIEAMNSVEVKVTDNWKYRKNLIDVTVIYGRDAELFDSDNEFSRPCWNHREYKEAQRRENETGRSCVKELCEKKCYWGLNKVNEDSEPIDDYCPYISQYMTKTDVRIKNHQHLFVQKSRFDNTEEWSSVDDTPRVIEFIDEDITKNCVDAVEYDSEKLERMKKNEIAVSSIESHCEDGKVKSAIDWLKSQDAKTLRHHQLKLIEAILTKGAMTSNEVTEWKQQSDIKELIDLVKTEVKLLNSIYGNLLKCDLNAKALRPIALCRKLTEDGHFNNIYVRLGKNETPIVRYAWKVKPNLTGNVVQLDATGREEILSLATGREFKTVRIDIEKHHDSKIVQVSNIAGAKSRYLKNEDYRNAINEFCRDKEVISFKADEHSDSDIWFGNARGTNSMYQRIKETNKPVVIKFFYNVNPIAVSDMYRALYPERDEPDMQRGKVQRVRRMSSGIHEPVTQYEYIDSDIQTIHDHLSRSEVEQDAGRSRYIRHNATVYLLFNKVVDITVDETIRWQDLTGFKDGNAKRSINAKNAAIAAVKDSIESSEYDGIIDKKKAFIQSGMPEKQFKKNKPTVDVMTENGFDVHNATLKSSSRNKSKQQVFVLAGGDASKVDYGNKTFVESEIIAQAESALDELEALEFNDDVETEYYDEIMW